MEAVVFIGIPGSGKSSFFKERFFRSHVRVSMDLLKTRHRERAVFETCLRTGQPLVIDNTNPARRDRAPYIAAARDNRFKVSGFYFRSTVEECLKRNASRSPAERVPDVAILSSAKKLELPSPGEGYDELFYVRLGEAGFEVEEWRDDV